MNQLQKSTEAESAGTANLDLLHWCNPPSLLPNRMGQVLSEQIASSRQLDVLTGYFYFNGVPELTLALEAKAKAGKPFHLRILIGMSAQLGMNEFAQEIIECEPNINLPETERKERYAKTLFEILKITPSAEKMNSDARLYNLFVRMLQDKTLKLEIKQTKLPNHGKLYLFYPEDDTQSGIYVLGSSNFSKQGLSQRQELNLCVAQDPDRIRCLTELYTELWDSGSDEITEIDPKKGSSEDPPPEDLSTVVTPITLQTNSPYVRPTPFEAYMALMKRYLGDSVPDADLHRAFENAVQGAGYTPFQYQLQGAAKAIGIIRDHGGVIIADAVGLGKSVTAALIATQAHPGGGVIIVPPTLVDEWKTEYIEKFKLDVPGRPWAVFSHTALAEAQNFCNKNAISMVIVDEAHRFRNPKVKGYETLWGFCNNRRVVLLTATPFNNVPADLAVLVNLFAAGAERLKENVAMTVYDYIVEQNQQFQELVFLQRNWNRLNRPRTIDKRFEDLEKKYTNRDFKTKQDIAKALKQIGDELFGPLHPYIIRRNRSDLRINPCYWEDSKPIRMPEQNVQGKYYVLSDTQKTAYQNVLEVFAESADSTTKQGFACTIYRIAEFVDTDEQTGNYLDNYRSMTLRHLIRRFESSPFAFKRSVEDLISRCETALSDLNDPAKLYFNPKGLDFADDEEEDSDAGDMQGMVYCRLGATCKGVPFGDKKDEEFIAGLQADLMVLKGLLKYAEVLLDNDSKLALLKELVEPSAKQEKGQGDPWLKSDKEASPIHGLPDGAPRRVVIFTMFIDTACYLAEKLAESYGEGIVMLAIDKQSGQRPLLNLGKVSVVHKSTAVTSCFDVKADNDTAWTAPRILVTTDKFSEGINLNRAGILVNYDIPWNPVRVIQRLGRINRINACWFKTIYAYNLYPEYQRVGTGERAAHGWATPQEIAAQKLILIHQLFFEDATILGDSTAGKEKPFGQLDEAAADSEPESEETLVQKRYLNALKRAGYITTKQVEDFEKHLFGYGIGMKTVRVNTAEADMLIFKQNGAQIRAEIFEVLHTTDMDQRSRPIKLLEALDKIASEPNDPCFSDPARFPDRYEEIEKRMKTPPGTRQGAIQIRRRSALYDKTLDIIEIWKKRQDLRDILDSLTRLHDAYQHLALTKSLSNQINEVGRSANRHEIEVIVRAIPLANAAAPTVETPINTELTTQETILTFVNEK